MPKGLKKIFSEANREKLWKGILFIVLMLTVLTVMAYALASMFSHRAGIHRIELPAASSGKGLCLYYETGTGKTPSTTEFRIVQKRFAELALKARRILSTTSAKDVSGNLRYLNQHPNQDVEVDPILYDVLCFLEQNGTRYHYLGPVYEIYFSLFQCTSDQDAAVYDPAVDPDLNRFCRMVTEFACSPEQIQLVLLGEKKVCLTVSEQYLAFAEENGFTNFLDLAWMRDAFVVDYVTESLADLGYFKGFIVSEDGFARTMDQRSDGVFTFPLYLRQGQEIHHMKTLSLEGSSSIVYLHDYPLKKGSGNYYVYESGALRCPYVNPSYGLCRAAAPDLAAVSSKETCGELVLLLAPVYLEDTVDALHLTALEREGRFIYCPEAGFMSP